MDYGVIAAIVTAAAALFAIIVSWSNSKKGSILKVVVESRVEYMQSLRSANATFIGLADPDVILQSMKTVSLVPAYPKDLAVAAGSLKTLLKPFYKIEQQLIKMINSIEKRCFALFAEDGSVDITKLKQSLELYTQLFAQYDWAYWQYVMKQADGKLRNSDEHFDKTYEETGEKYKESNWISLEKVPVDEIE